MCCSNLDECRGCHQIQTSAFQMLVEDHDDNTTSIFNTNTVDLESSQENNNYLKETIVKLLCTHKIKSFFCEGQIRS